LGMQRTRQDEINVKYTKIARKFSIYNIYLIDKAGIKNYYLLSIL